MEIRWNSNDEVEYSNVNVSPPVESGSTFTTPNNTIQLSVLYNQDYNISVVANNCAGNSTPTEVNVRIGKLGNILFTIWCKSIFSIMHLK